MIKFSLKNYNEDPFVMSHEKNAKWARDIDGMEVVNGYCCGYMVTKRWCEEVK